jgi:hypothetical protein
MLSRKLWALESDFCSLYELVVVYPEVLVFAPVLTPLCRYVAYLRAAGALVQPLDELLQPLPFPLGLNLDASIEQVPHSSVQAESCCLFEYEPPVEHALDDAGDYGVQQCSVSLICHE